MHVCTYSYVLPKVRPHRFETVKFKFTGDTSLIVWNDRRSTLQTLLRALPARAQTKKMALKVVLKPPRPSCTSRFAHTRAREQESDGVVVLRSRKAPPRTAKSFLLVLFDPPALDA